MDRAAIDDGSARSAMKYRSTRSNSPSVDFSEAVRNGLAPDGGLYVPDRFPQLNWRDFRDTDALDVFAAHLLKPFVAGDRLESQLGDICAKALSFPIPLKPLRDYTSVLELFHGPTSAFKDVGARFLAELSSRVGDASKRSTVIVATSGDTGGAVAGAFHGREGFDVVVLFPKGKISARQEKQITCWGDNVRAFAVEGTFDDCQRIVKGALADSEWRSQRSFISANSISVARLLPQMVYYARAAVDTKVATGRDAAFIIPSGNLGNSVAALWAKRAGFPIAMVCLATNANRAISDYFASGQWKPQVTIATLANAMDVGNPSNMERLLDLYPDFNLLKADVTTELVLDSDIESAIRTGPAQWGEIWCPHTATAAIARERLRQHRPDLEANAAWIMVATAHPAKFETIVEPLIGKEVSIPPSLAMLLDRQLRFDTIEPSVEALKSKLVDGSAH